MPYTSFDEQAGSPTWNVTPGPRQATRMARIPWADIDDFIEFMFPAGGLLSPRQFPGNSNLVASSLQIDPFADEEGQITAPVKTDLDYDSLNEYATAKVTIQYATPQFNPTQQDDPVLLLSHRWAIGGEFLTIESYGLQWKDGGEVSRDTTAGVLIPTIEHQMTWSRVSRPPFSTIRTRIAKVNNDTVTFSTGEIAPETLLFLGAELQRDITSDGALAWRVTYRFSEKRWGFALGEADTIGGEAGAAAITVPGWNHFLRTEDKDRQFDADVQGNKGIYRLQLKDGTAPTNAIYQLASVPELFVEDAA